MRLNSGIGVLLGVVVCAAAVGQWTRPAQAPHPHLPERRNALPGSGPVGTGHVQGKALWVNSGEVKHSETHIPWARVVASDSAGKVVRFVNADAQGHYRMAVQPGSYNVEISQDCEIQRAAQHGPVPPPRFFGRIGPEQVTVVANKGSHCDVAIVVVYPK